MTKKLKNLPSEQLPNDGGYHLGRLIDAANNRLNKIGRHGKRAKIKVTPRPGKPISAQFSLPGIGQKSYGLNLSLSKSNLIEAEKICTLITSQLVAGRFTMDEFYSLVGKSEKTTKREKPLTCGEMLEQYKAHYFKQRKDNKASGAGWNNSHRHIEKIFLKHDKDVISLNIIRKVIDSTENNTSARTCHLNGLANLLKHFDNHEFKQVIKRYKSENNPKPKDKYIPTDTRIDYVYQTGFEINKHCPKKYRNRYVQWQFVYSLLAVYGLRVHEAWNIKNWTETVILKAGDWVVIPDDTEDINNESENGKYSYRQIEQDEIIPAILDPDNEDYLLCIGHETKTGYRVAFPISPSGVGKDCNWIKEFKIVQPMNLPDIEKPLARFENGTFRCTQATMQWFNSFGMREKNRRNNISSTSSLRYGFTAHALRHAYNIRGHKLGVNQKMLADSLGHGMDINLRTYTKHEQGTSKIQGIRQEMINHSTRQSEVKRLRDENEYLKTKVAKLETELAMYKTIKQNKNSN